MAESDLTPGNIITEGALGAAISPPDLDSPPQKRDQSLQDSSQEPTPETRIRESLELQKLTLEIATLQRQIDTLGSWKRILAAVIDTWVPSLIAASVLFTLVPYANFLAWRSEKSIEFQNSYLNKQMEIYSDFALNSTRVAQLIASLNDLARVREGKSSRIRFDVRGRTEAASRLTKIEDERREVEPRFVKSLRDVELYFGGEAANSVRVIRALYHSTGEPPGDQFVASFLKEKDNLATIMEGEIRRQLDEAGVRTR